MGFLKRSFGVHGEDLHRSANGEDTSPVRRWGDWDDVKSVGHGVTFRRNIRGEDDVSLAVTELADWVSTRLRLYEMKAYGVKRSVCVCSSPKPGSAGWSGLSLRHRPFAELL